MGVYLNKDLPAFAMNDEIAYDSNHDVKLDHNFTMLLGLNSNIAFSFSLAMDSYVDDDNEDTEKATALGIGFGYKNEKMDIGVNAWMPGYSQELSGGDEATESKFILDANG